MNIEHINSPRFGRRRILNAINKYKRNENGTTAVEFAIVGGPFLLLLFAIIETSLFFFASQYLESTVDDVTRKLRTGQMKSINTAEEFKTAVCAEVVALFDCDNKMRFRVETALKFDGLDSPPGTDPDDYDGDGNLKDSEFYFQKPGPVEVLQVTATYLWPIYTNYSAPLTPDGEGGYALINATAVVRTEPFS